MLYRKSHTPPRRREVLFFPLVETNSRPQNEAYRQPAQPASQSSNQPASQPGCQAAGQPAGSIWEQTSGFFRVFYKEHLVLSKEMLLRCGNRAFFKNNVAVAAAGRSLSHARCSHSDIVLKNARLPRHSNFIFEQSSFYL